ncbi:hypothetical protein MMC07_002773 [Pseudocyphellaria aurata]|nr:hypothetical protein [Pseudocyphellaria aurata]
MQNVNTSSNMGPEMKALEQGGKLKTNSGDIFDKSSDGSSVVTTTEPTISVSPQSLPEGFDELPIELISLTDRFIESLTAKVHHAPPSIDKLSEIFQEFYVKAASHISTHISALSSRQYREASPNSPISKNLTKDARRLRSMSKDTVEYLEKPAPEQQMLTPKEISDRRKARRLLEQKGVALEEAVEKRVCERVYNRIWRHKTTLDEVRDEKLRSRTAALALVGIGLEDLGITFEKKASGTEETTDAQVEGWISKARDGLLKMNDARFPLGKLQHLAAAHKSIVDLLTNLHQSSSSADEILPTLIYTLITTPPEGINVISNLHFTQRFRAASKIDGEMAYCLTNLEAAVSFLETVDLASLRSDEPLEGPPKSSSRPSTPRDDDSGPAGQTPIFGENSDESPAPANKTVPQSIQTATSHSLPSSGSQTSQPEFPANSRRLSDMFQPPALALGAASDAVRNTADQGFKNIGNTLDNSFQFLFGRLKEQKLNGRETDAERGVILPMTLDDARRLVDPNSIDEEGNTSGTSSVAERADAHVDSHSKMDDRILGVFAGRRDRSADSAQSSGSGKRVAFAAETAKVKDKAGSPGQLSSAGPITISPSVQHDHPHAGHAAVESMRNLGNSLNPLNRFANMNVMRFGRSSSATLTTTTPTATLTTEKPAQEALETAGKDRATAAELRDISPPIQRYINVADARELKIGEVDELLRDYKRLASALQGSRSN